MGEAAACIACLSEAIDIATVQNNPMLMLSTLPRLAQTYWAQGQLNRAAQICQTGLDYCDQKGLGRSPMSDSLFVSWGAILCERNELDRAAEFIGRGLAVNRSGEAVLNQHFAYRTMARVYLAQRNLAAAEDFVRQAEALTHGHSIPLHHGSALIGLKAQLLILQGRLIEAQHSLEMFADQSVVEPPFSHNGRLYLAWAQLQIAQGNWPAADQALDRLFKFTQASGQSRWFIPGHILRARLELDRQNLPQALAALEAGLELAVPEGFLQDFLDEGEPLIQLLREAVRRKVRPDLASVVLGRVSPTRPVANPIDLVEPLSDREREVLQLIAEGLSNQAIAARLYLSLRTIKFHTSNIFGKLGVKNRTEAVARARALGLLSA
jgi:LuxR family maltose regulon positive regulatory protein